MPAIREVSRDYLCQVPVKSCLILKTFPSSIGLFLLPFHQIELILPLLGFRSSLYFANDVHYNLLWIRILYIYSCFPQLGVLFLLHCIRWINFVDMVVFLWWVSHIKISLKQLIPLYLYFNLFNGNDRSKVRTRPGLLLTGKSPGLMLARVHGGLGGVSSAQ